MTTTQNQNLTLINDIASSLNETTTKTALELLEKLLDAQLLALVPEISDLDKMKIETKIKLVKYYSLSEEERNKIPYTELYNEETIKTMEEAAKGINVSKPLNSIEELFEELDK